MSAPFPPVSRRQRVLAVALEGPKDEAREALRELASLSDLEALAFHHRLAPALARRLEAPPAPLAAALHRTAAIGLATELELHQAGEALDGEGLAWVVIKGCDLRSRVYARREDRPVGDVDLLVPREDLAGARRALEAAGWRSRAAGPRYERFLRDEGYCWQAHRPGGPLLEVHFRLWGLVPGALAEEILRARRSEPPRPCPAHAYLLAALHAWMDPPPRPLATWWDLQRLAAETTTPALVEGIVRACREHQLQLPVALAACQAAALWPGASAHSSVAEVLALELRTTEARLYRRFLSHGETAVTLGRLTLARLLARRPSRSGWRAVLRRLWAHPGVVERATEEGTPWFARRLQYFLGRYPRR